MPPINLIILGAGNRGTTYAEYAFAHPDQAVVVGVAEPREFCRQRLAAQHHLPVENVVARWEQLAERPKFADAALICTQDGMHAEPAVAFAQQGYAILLEKPMAPTEADCARIVQAVKANGTLFAVCHVMRYTRYTQALKAIVDSGALGDIVSVQHLEPVGYWHQAHSYVRGNWRNEALSSPMLLAKSCHDLDWLRHILGRRCVKVSSFGSLTHFRKAHKPAEAGDALRCLDCAHEPECAYSAKKLYLGRLRGNRTGWPLSVITADVTEAGVTEALRAGPYGRCVYECDNDVVDHQVVNLLYDNGATATFTMTAFTEAADRATRLFGTRGELRGNGERIVRHDFVTDKTTVTEIKPVDEGGHGGGDYGLMQSFVEAVRLGDQGKILSGADESLETHLTVFAAERARRESRVVDVPTLA